MIISLTIWLGSLIFLTLLFLGKKREMKGSQAIIRIGTLAMDQKLSMRYQALRAWLKQLSWQYWAHLFHRWAEKAEKVCLIIADRVVYKLSHARDYATGKDMQKNKGYIAFKLFFRKFIE